MTNNKTRSISTAEPKTLADFIAGKNYWIGAMGQKLTAWASIAFAGQDWAPLPAEEDSSVVILQHGQSGALVWMRAGSDPQKPRAKFFWMPEKGDRQPNSAIAARLEIVVSAERSDAAIVADFLRRLSPAAIETHAKARAESAEREARVRAKEELAKRIAKAISARPDKGFRSENFGYERDLLVCGSAMPDGFSVRVNLGYSNSAKFEIRVDGAEAVARFAEMLPKIAAQLKGESLENSLDPRD